MNKKQDNRCTLMAVIPAAGSGSRMQSKTPKQLLTVGGKTLLEFSIDAIRRDPRVQRIYVSVSNPQSEISRALAQRMDDNVVFIQGGASRAESVLAGVEASVRAAATHVLVHDAARPCLPQSALRHVIDVGLSDEQGAILAVPVRDSLKRSVMMNEGTSVRRVDSAVARDELWQAQTPQVFDAHQLLTAIDRMGAHNPQLTDEASAMQWCGFQPVLVPGSIRNLKVTHPEDFECVRDWLLAEQIQGTE